MAVNRRGFFGRLAALVTGAFFAPKVLARPIQITDAQVVALMSGPPLPNFHKTYREYREFCLRPEVMAMQRENNFWISQLNDAVYGPFKPM